MAKKKTKKMKEYDSQGYLTEEAFRHRQMVKNLREALGATSLIQRTCQSVKDALNNSVNTLGELWLHAFPDTSEEDAFPAFVEGMAGMAESAQFKIELVLREIKENES